MKKTDLLNAIDAFAYARQTPSSLLQDLASDHLRSLHEKLPDEIQEKNSVIDPCSAPKEYSKEEDALIQGAARFCKACAH